MLSLVLPRLRTGQRRSFHCSVLQCYPTICFCLCFCSIFLSYLHHDRLRDRRYTAYFPSSPVQNLIFSFGLGTISNVDIKAQRWCLQIPLCMKVIFL
ncbi:hypothetical protein BJX76DRAFT_342086, partial [Aspergillus varians]